MGARRTFPPRKRSSPECHEMRSARWSSLAPQARYMVTDETIKAIQGLSTETSP